MQRAALIFLFTINLGSCSLLLIADIVFSKEKGTIKEERLRLDVEKLKSSFNHSEEHARTIIALLEQMKQSKNQIIVAEAAGDVDLKKVLRLESTFRRDLAIAYISVARNQVDLKKLTDLSEISPTDVSSTAKDLREATTKTSLLLSEVVLSGTEWAEAQINFVCLKQKNDCRSAFKEYIAFIVLLTSSADSAIKPIISSDFVKKVRY